MNGDFVGSLKDAEELAADKQVTAEVPQANLLVSGGLVIPESLVEVIEAVKAKLSNQQGIDSRSNAIGHHALKHGAHAVEHVDLMSVRPLLKSLNKRLTRQRYAKTPMREYLSQIQPNWLAEMYLEFYDAHPFYKEVCAGAKHHHWWKGGLEEHVCEMIGMGLDLMDLYPGDYTFTKTDLIITAFLHDFNKIWVYRYITDLDREKNAKKFKPQQVFTYVEGANNILDGYSQILLEIGRTNSQMVPTNQQWSAIMYHEGGYSSNNFGWGGTVATANTVNSHNHLAPFLHAMDMISSQILGRSIA